MVILSMIAMYIGLSPMGKARVVYFSSELTVSITEDLKSNFTEIKGLKWFWKYGRNNLEIKVNTNDKQKHYEITRYIIKNHFLTQDFQGEFFGRDLEERNPRPDIRIIIVQSKFFIIDKVLYEAECENLDKRWINDGTQNDKVEGIVGSTCNLKGEVFTWPLEG